MKKKRFVIVGAVVVLAVIGGAFAYFNQTLTVENPFDTGKFDSVLVEDFNPSDGENWQPGSTVNKDIEVKNTGDNDLLVRVRFDEKWAKKNGGGEVKKNEGMDTTTGQESDSDGLITNDKSVVSKKLLGEENWVFHDGYWYYKNNLKKGETTDKFLDSVTLLENTDMGVYEVKNYYTTKGVAPGQDEIGDDPATQWTAYTGKVPAGAKHSMSKTVLNADKSGYADLDYTLTITAQTVQATEAAVKNAFGDNLPAGLSWNYFK